MSREMQGGGELIKVHNKSISYPRVIIFDWHGTLVNTLDAMYQALEKLLPQLEELGLVDQLTPEEKAATQQDANLIRYIRIFRHLNPQILAEQRISRTDIFDAIFGTNGKAKEVAHQAYNVCYRECYGEVKPLQDGILGYLQFLKRQGLKLAIATNRSREFLSNEIERVDEGAWVDQFDAILCGDEADQYKPAPSIILQALDALGAVPGSDVWYVGDSVVDMITAKAAGVTPIFFNGAFWEESWLQQMFPESKSSRRSPDAFVNDFDQLLDLLEFSARLQASDLLVGLHQFRPERLPARQPPLPRIEPDWHPAVADLRAPKIILFDWHATLVDTLDAMYHAVDDMLPELAQLGLERCIVDSAACKSKEDAKLVDYVRNYSKLHPKVKLDRKISRTDIFEVLFGEDEQAKRVAHHAFTRHYRNHFGTVLPFEPQVKSVLQSLRKLNLQLGITTNRDREFFVQELASVEGTGWEGVFDTVVCGDDTTQRKPNPAQLQLAVENLGEKIGLDVWYVEDSTTDTIASKTAGMTNVFFNGAQWDQPWLDKIFPGTKRYPYKPDVVVNDFSELWALVLACLDKN